MQPLYQKYGVQLTDRSKGQALAQEQQGKNLQGVIAGIKSMMENQEGQIIQANTQQATDLLRQRLQAEGLGILGKPIDTGVALRGFGNMVDKAAVDKVLATDTDLLKNSFINKFSAEADVIGAETGDYIKGREHLKQGLLTAGAPSTFADQEAGNYDLRKAAEIKNIAVRDGERFASAVADVTDMAAQHGVRGATEAINVLKAEYPKHKQAEIEQKLRGHFNAISKPKEEDEASIANMLGTFDSETKSLIDTRRENLKQKNDQTSTVSSHSSTSEGVTNTRITSGGRSRKGGTDEDIVDLLGKKVTNGLERFSGSNDSVVLREKYRYISDQVGDRDIADRIFKDAADYAYPGDGAFGNDYSKKDFKKMDARIAVLLKEGGESQGNTGRSASSSTYSKGGNISFTSADKDGVTALISDRAKQRVEFREKLYEAARDRSLGVNTDPDVLSNIAKDYFSKQDVKPTSTPTPTTKSSGDAPTNKTTTTKKVDTVPNPFTSGNPSKGKSVDSEVKRLVAIAEKQEAEAKAKTNLTVAATNPVSSMKVTPNAVPTKSQSPLVNWFRQKMANSPEPVKRGSRYVGTASKN